MVVVTVGKDGSVVVVGGGIETATVVVVVGGKVVVLIGESFRRDDPGGYTSCLVEML